jgi:hypothetical protein
MRTLQAGPLTLEPQVAAHAAEMFAVLSDPAIYEYENAPPVSIEALRTRYAKLESRRSSDGGQQWLNWVMRIDGAGLIGYVQATVYPDNSASIAYEMASTHWGRGLGRHATEADAAGARRPLRRHETLRGGEAAQLPLASPAFRASASRSPSPSSARSAGSSPTRR